MWVPVALLGILSLVGGGMYLLDVPHILDSFLEPVFHHYAAPVAMIEGAELLKEPLMLASVALGLLGIAVAWAMYVWRPSLAGSLGSALPWLYQLLLNKYYVDEVYGLLVVRPALWTGRFLSGIFDPAITDGLVGAVTATVRGVSLGLRRLQTGYVRDYALAIMAGAVVIVIYLVQVGGVR